jgi:hypothetical protein
LIWKPIGNWQFEIESRERIGNRELAKRQKNLKKIAMGLKRISNLRIAHCLLLIDHCLLHLAYLFTIAYCLLPVESCQLKIAHASVGTLSFFILSTGTLEQ